MAGLDDVDETKPTGNDSLKLGDDYIRALIAKIKEFADKEHTLSGSHSFSIGSTAQRDLAGSAGRIYILTTPNVQDELQYDNGAIWKTITKNQIIVDNATIVSTHIAASPIDHPDNSINGNKLQVGIITKKHLDGSTDVTSLKPLVNYGDGDPFHTHGTTGIRGNSISTAKIQDEAVTGDKISKNTVNSALINITDTWTPNKGIYTLLPKDLISIELFISGTFQESLDFNTPIGSMYFDGINMRVKNKSGMGSVAIYYHKF